MKTKAHKVTHHESNSLVSKGTGLLGSQPLVSVVMNCYNGEKFLRTALDSVFDQSYKNWEIIFWDNVSTDRSAEIAKSYGSKLRYFKAAEHTPLGKARKAALEKASGKYIAFLDCDDVYLPHKLSVQVQLLEDNDFALVYSGFILVDEKGVELGEHLASNSSGFIFPDLLRNYEVNMQSVMLKKAVLDENKLDFNDSLSYCPDYNLFLYISARFNIGVVRPPLVLYRRSSDSLSRQTLELVSSEVKISLDRIFASFPHLRLQYKEAGDAAYHKLYYYDAVAAIYRSDMVAARRHLRCICFKRWVYFIIYLILHLPIPKSMILRCLRR